MAFHVRLASPPGLTEQLVGVLSAQSGVFDVVVLPRAVRRGSGATGQPRAAQASDGQLDAVLFDVQNRSANAVLGQLRAFRDEHGSSIAIVDVDAIIGEHPEQAGRAARFGFVQRDAAPVWDVVEARIRASAVYAPSFFVLLAMAALIAAVGILTNSQILIVGAMVIGPEYNAIMGVALGIDRRDWRPVARGALALFFGFAAAILLTLAFGAAIRWSGNTPRPYAAGVRPVADFISSPNLYSVIVAVLAGIVGVVSLTESRASAVIGVFISITTIPAAAGMGLSFAYADWSRAAGSAVQLLLNVAVLIVMGVLVLRLQRIIWAAVSGPGR